MSKKLFAFSKMKGKAEENVKKDFSNLRDLFTRKNKKTKGLIWCGKGEAVLQGLHTLKPCPSPLGRRTWRHKHLIIKYHLPHT